MLPTVTVVVDPYGEYRRPREAGIPFERTLRTLLAQTFPSDRTTVMVTCVADELPYVDQLVAGERRVRTVVVPPGSGYYQKKNYGAQHADTELVS